jgi:DnaK suppressor protein
MCLDSEQRAALKHRLLELKSNLVSGGFSQMSPNRTDDVGRRDDDFQPLNEMNQVLQSEKNKNTKVILKRIDQALLRFDDEPELVGACEECEECIKQRRIEIFPYALYCVKCKDMIESQDSERTGRRNLTDFKS